ncbi:Protease Do-like 7 [Gossypium arboreum]|uniref:Protease Do-like 7 n=1 Tax=Gossypium arboreum TaxID=29729 RepID=A0A0B0M8H6_GOSAR|nr:Protease Do-like 7 [Gossypium arboreum]
MEDPMERIGSEEESGLESTIKEDLSMEIDPPFKENVATAEDWRKALNKVVPAVVVLRTTACRAFDTESASAGSATGFVVDKRRGIILTNRHVVKPGPVVAEAMFLNREEITVHPLYRDPVHDFGFFRYDPNAIQFLDYEEIPLAPEAACVGLEIRVVGNDSGEKVSILAGTIARLDRDAPQYTKDGYNDFNTFYLQAASGTKGGSSGSPVIDWQGRAVALNAGGKTTTASAFFLPLERVVRALKFFQKGGESYTSKWEVVSIPRGTLQTTFLHKGFDEIRRLGLQSETEQMARHASAQGETGMLVVDSVVPGGPARNHLEPGDVLVRVITQFLRLETLLDDSVEQNIELEIERGGTPLSVQLVVQDLHSITPAHFLEVSGAVIHPLSYQQARNFRFQCGLVYVSEPGYMLSRAAVPRHAIIKKLAGEEISKLEDLISVLCKLSQGSRIPLEYISYTDRHRRKCGCIMAALDITVALDVSVKKYGPKVHKALFPPLASSLSLPLVPACFLYSTCLLCGHVQFVLVTVDRHEWYAPPQIYTRDDSSGLWTVKPAFQLEFMLPSGVNVEATPMEHIHAYNHQGLTDGATSMETSSEHASAVLHSQNETGTGSKIKRVEEYMSSDGFVTDCSLNTTVEVMLEDTIAKENVLLRDGQGAAAVANASIAERVIEPTLVMFESWIILLRSFYYMSSYCYNDYPALHRGDSVYLVGLNRSLQATSRKSVVTNPCATLNIGSADCPRYRATNMEVVELDTDFGSAFSGVLTDEHGRVRAIWASFSTQLKVGSNTSEDHHFVRGIPVYAISQVLHNIISGGNGPHLLINGVKRPMPLIRILEVELYRTLLSKARSFGLSDDWIQALIKKDPARRQVLRVKGCLAGSKAENLLEQGDMVLAVNKEPVTCFRDLENVCHALDFGESGGELNMTIFRQGRELDLVVGTDVRDGNGTTRVINWCGCIVQDPHPAVRALGFLPEEGHGVYVARWCRGSPVHRYGLYALQWIVEVNGKPTPDLDAFVNVTKELEHGEFVRVRTIHLNSKPRVLTLKQDLHYWPTWELRFDPETAIWHRQTIKALDCQNL